VFNFISSEQGASDSQMPRILAMGIKEFTRPGALGGALLTLAAILVSVGMLRMGREEV
jgi:hypothetical protein